jgi:hypothetical protein
MWADGRSALLHFAGGSGWTTARAFHGAEALSLGPLSLGPQRDLIVVGGSLQCSADDGRTWASRCVAPQPAGTPPPR